MVSPWCAIIGVGVSRDIYSLKFHADVGVIGTIQLLHGMMTLAMDVAIGYLQVSRAQNSPCCTAAAHCRTALPQSDPCCRTRRSYSSAPAASARRSGVAAPLGSSCTAR